MSTTTHVRPSITTPDRADSGRSSSTTAPRGGEKPAQNEVQRQSDEVIAQARSRWETLQTQNQERRRMRHAA